MAEFNPTSAALSAVDMNGSQRLVSVSNNLLHQTYRPRLENKENIPKSMPRPPGLAFQIPRDKTMVTPFQDFSNRPRMISHYNMPAVTGGHGLDAGGPQPEPFQNSSLSAQGCRATGLCGQQTWGPLGSPHAAQQHGAMGQQGVQPVTSLTSTDPFRGQGGLRAKGMLDFGFPPDTNFSAMGCRNMGQHSIQHQEPLTSPVPAQGHGAIGLRDKWTQGPWNSSPDAQGCEAMEPRHMQPHQSWNSSPDAQRWGAMRPHGMQPQESWNSPPDAQGWGAMGQQGKQTQGSWNSPPDAQGWGAMGQQGKQTQGSWNSPRDAQGWGAMGQQGKQTQGSWNSPPDAQGFQDTRLHVSQLQGSWNSSLPLQRHGAMGWQDKQLQRPLTPSPTPQALWPLEMRDMPSQQSWNSSLPLQGHGAVGLQGRQSQGPLTSSLPAQGQGVVGLGSMPPQSFCSSLETYGLGDMGAQGMPPQRRWNSTAAGQGAMPGSWSLPQQSSQAPSGIYGQAGSQPTVALAPSSHGGFGMHNTSRTGLNNLAKTQAPGLPHLPESNALSLSVKGELPFSNSIPPSALDPHFNSPCSMDPTPSSGPVAFKTDLAPATALESATTVTVSGSLASTPDVGGSSTSVPDITNPTLPLSTTDEIILSENELQSILLNQSDDQFSVSLLDDLSDSPQKLEDMADKDLPSPLVQPLSPTLPQATEASEPSPEQRTTDHEKLPLSSEKKMDHGPCAQFTPGVGSALSLGENSQGLMQMKSKNQHSCRGEVGQEDGSSAEGHHLMNAQLSLGSPGISMTRSGRISRPVDRIGIASRPSHDAGSSCSGARIVLESQHHRDPYPIQPPRRRRRKSPLKSREISDLEAMQQYWASHSSQEMQAKIRQAFTEEVNQAVVQVDRSARKIA